MSCNNQVINGIAKPCEGSTGGIIVAYVAPWADDIYTYDTSSASTGEVTGIKSGVTWSVFNFRRGSSSMTGSRTIDNTAGVNFVQSVVSLTFSRQDTPKRLEMNALALSDMAIMVKDANGKVHCLGLTAPCEVTNSGSATGQASTDGNNYTVEITDTNSQGFPPFLADSVQIVTNED